MNKVLIFLIFITFSYSESPSFDFSYELKYGDGEKYLNNNYDEGYEFEFFENFLNINSNYRDYHLFLELEFSDPPILGYSKTDFDDIVSRMYLDKQFQDSYFKIGNIDALYGAGLGLYTFPDQNIDFDNSLIGLEYKYSFTDHFEVFGIYGVSDFEQRSNPAITLPDRFSENSVAVMGVNYDCQIGYGHLLFKNQDTYFDSATLNQIYLSQGDRITLFDFDYSERVDELIQNYDGINFWQNIGGDSLNTKSFVFGYGIYSNFGDFYLELEKSNYDKLLGDRVNGNRKYFSYGTNLGNIGLSYEYKDYDMPYDILTFTAPPTVAIESTSILAGRNTHSVNYGDEVGHQFEIVGDFWADIDFLANISLSHRHSAKQKKYRRGAGLADYVNESTFTGVAGSDEDDYLNSLLQSSQDYISSPSLIIEKIESPDFFDYLLFDYESDDFKAFYPYRQVYAEVSGYLNSDLYIKVGYDLYNEIIKSKDNLVYLNDDEAISQGFNAFYGHAESIVADALEYHSSNPIQFCNILPGCAENPGEYGFEQQFGMSSENYLADLSFSNYDEYFLRNFEYHEAWTIPTQLTYELFAGSSINFYLEYQSKKITKTSYNFQNIESTAEENYKDVYFSGSYNHNGFWTLTLFYEQEEQPIKTLDWSGIDVSFDMADNGQLSLFSGSQKGGRVCANGICADQPGFDGVKVTYRTFF